MNWVDTSSFAVGKPSRIALCTMQSASYEQYKISGRFYPHFLSSQFVYSTAFTSDVDPLFDDVPQDTGYCKHPVWNLKWSENELGDLVASRYDQRMLRLVHVQYGMTPSALLLLCDFTETNGKRIRSLVHYKRCRWSIQPINTQQ